MRPGPLFNARIGPLEKRDTRRARERVLSGARPRADGQKAMDCLLRGKGGPKAQEGTEMSSAKDIGGMRTALAALSKKHPELEKFVEDANEELWALEVVLEIEEEEEEEDEDHDD